MSVRREKDLSEHSAPSVPVAALKALEQQWRKAGTRYLKERGADEFSTCATLGCADDLLALIAHAEER